MTKQEWSIQAVPVESASQFIPLSITVAVGMLALAFFVVRRVQRSGGNEVTARRFPPQLVSRQRMTLIAALLGVTTGLGLVFSGRRTSEAAASIGDRITVATDSATRDGPIVVMLAIGLLVVVVVLLLTLRDGER